MRFLAGAFGIVCGAVIVAIVARYGYQSADNPIDSAILAFMFGTVALGGLGAHALAARVWREHRGLSLLIGLVGVAALSVNLSNSLGALAGRQDEKQAGRAKTAEIVRNLRRDLARIQSEREAMSFAPTDAAAVAAAKTALAAAEKAHKAECDVRGTRCREREADERKAAGELATVTVSKAATDRATALDGEISRLSGEIAASGPVLSANSEGAALARLFSLPESWADWLTTWKGFALAALAEVLIVLSLVSFEVLRREKPAKAAQRRAGSITIDVEPMESRRPDSDQRPRLVASSVSPVGSVVLVMAEILEPDAGRIEFAEAYGAYCRACGASGKTPAEPQDFSAAMKRVCREFRIGIERQGDLVFFNGIRLKKMSDAC